MVRKKLTAEEKAARKHQRSAERKNARIREDVPLFADQLPQNTAEGEYWHWRRNKACAAEETRGYYNGVNIFQCLQLQRIWKVAFQFVGEEEFVKLDAYSRRTYPCETYWYGFWKKVLSGERVEFGRELVKDRQPGQPAVVCTDWYEQKHMTSEEFYALFPYQWDDPPAAPDDGGLARLVEKLLRHRQS
jgi:hypothetical protein